jgi:hypothetical protein
VEYITGVTTAGARGLTIGAMNKLLPSLVVGHSHMSTTQFLINYFSAVKMFKLSKFITPFKLCNQYSAAWNIKAVIVMTAAFASTASWAGRPLATEDAGILEKGKCELESFAGKQAHAKGVLGAVQLGCGIDFDTQFAFGAFREVASDPDTGYLTFNGKTAFQNLTEDQAGFVIAYTLLSGRKESDYLGYVSSEVKGVITIPYQGWLLHGNAGLLHTRSRHDRRITWGVAAELPGAIGPFDLMGEVYGDNRSSPWVQVAARWAAIPDRFFIDASFGIQTNRSHTQLATIGMKLAF